MSAIRWARSLFRSISANRPAGTGIPPRLSDQGTAARLPRHLKAIRASKEIVTVCHCPAASREDIVRPFPDESLCCRSQISMGLAGGVSAVVFAAMLLFPYASGYGLGSDPLWRLLLTLWNASDDWKHGMFVFPIAAILLFLKRKELAERHRICEEAIRRVRLGRDNRRNCPERGAAPEYSSTPGMSGWSGVDYPERGNGSDHVSRWQGAEGSETNVTKDTRWHPDRGLLYLLVYR
jgi:hypothetical protein